MYGTQNATVVAYWRDRALRAEQYLREHADPLCPRCFDTFGLAATHNYDCPVLINGPGGGE